jgi:hypothetical protein
MMRGVRVTLSKSTKYGIVVLGLISVLILGLFLANVVPELSQDDAIHLSVNQDTNEELESHETGNEVNSSPYEGEPVVMGVSGIMEELSYEDLNSRSSVILIGTVKEIIPARWNTPDGTRPAQKIDDSDILDVMYTDIIIQVDEYLKNPGSAKEVTVRVLGGTIGNETILVEDSPSFGNNETVLVYLNGESSPYNVTGEFQGKFTITDDGMAVRDKEEPMKLGELINIIENGE